MNRRHFLATLAAGVGGLALDPERALWVPGAKKIFLPSPKTTIAVLGERLQKGDIFTITDSPQGPYYAVNPLTRQATPHLQQFIVTADISADGTIPLALVHPPIIDPLRGKMTAKPVNRAFYEAMKHKDRGWERRRG